MLQRRNIIAFIIGLIAVSCATVVPPSGGEIDTTPPVPIKMKPENHSKNFNKNKVVIEFDEFVVLDKLTQQMVVSPEMQEKPEVSIRGKKIIITLPDSLNKNTTYTIFFGNAIVNFKENIPITNFEYVFSTGDEVDSLMIEGHAINAFDHKPMEGSFVMLYKETADSVPYKKKPYYLSKVDASGYFRLNNLSAGRYKLFALQDKNNNYLFDQPTEEIAFLDTLIEPYPDPKSYNSVSKDSTDSTAVEPPQHSPLVLYYFIEAVKEQFILSSKLLKPNKFEIVFAKPVQSLEMRALNLKKDSIWHFDKMSLNGDTLTSWLLGLRQDTLIIEVSDDNNVLDTLRFILHKGKKKTTEPLFNRKRKNEKEKSSPKVVKIPKIEYSSNARGGFPFYADINFTFKTPIIRWEPSKIKILRQRDTIIDTLNTNAYFTDSVYQMKLVIPTQFKEYKRYGIFIPDSTFFDIYGHTQDTISNMFVTTEMREYGSLALSINYSEQAPLIVQLLDEKNMVVFQNIIHISQTIDFPYLKAGKYRLKAIEDKNENGKWDTGDYIKKHQPEKVYFVKKPISVRANWDIRHQWIIE
ncbi:MAG TPA: hypothetical protein EYP69_04115 [Bacteroidales bacterium]|nr:hypothetical protein [Bacteroidales bacterium]